MPKVMIINIPMMYHCVLQVQSISLMSAASTAFILCIAMFITKAFNLDSPYNTYIIIRVIISVISAAVNISTLARKLFKNVWIWSYFRVYLNFILSDQRDSFYFYVGLLDLIAFLGHWSNLG